MDGEVERNVCRGSRIVLRKKTIQDMQDMAIKHGGKCLSNEYINSSTNLKWECNEGHVWEATPNNIRKGTWCSKCAVLQRCRTIEDMCELAKRRGGKCLSTIYVHNKIKLKWECSEGHTWEMTPNSVQQSQWCPSCSGHVAKTIEDMCELARQKNGKCLSQKYTNSSIKIRWECSEGHKFLMAPNSVQNGRWCSVCGTYYISEHITRCFFEYIFNKQFPKIRLDFLINSNGNKMELDGYCEDLRIAFEYHGMQHYKEIAMFKKITLQERAKDDKLKKRQCLDNGIILIEIPYTVKHEDIGMHICKELAKHNIEVPMSYEEVEKIDYKKFNVYQKSKIDEMILLAEECGGKCLSKNYINSSTKLIWQCKKGHEWEATSNNVKKGQWCPECANTKKTIEEMNKLASTNHGRCLSTEYINTNTKLKWKCNKGHVWSATPNSIQQGSWCPYCVGNAKKTIENMRKFAEEHHGKCLSVEYINSSTKLIWQCNEGHVWEAVPNSVMRGSWCPHCVGIIKKNIDEMHRLAERHGGKCLSKKYVNAHTKLEWQCKDEHKFWMSYHHVQSGSWCPYCVGKHKTIKNMYELARNRGGKCLSVKYTDAHTKLKWECSEGHEWEATPNNVRKGTWCPKCSRIKRNLK